MEKEEEDEQERRRRTVELDGVGWAMVRGDTEGARIPKKRLKPQSQVTRVKFKDANPNPSNVYPANLKGGL